MKKLTEKQKKEFVLEDTNAGRDPAISTLPSEIKNSKELKPLLKALYAHEDFGEGDKLETILWEKIIDILDLKDAYKKYWGLDYED